MLSGISKKHESITMKCSNYHYADIYNIEEESRFKQGIKMSAEELCFILSFVVSHQKP